MTDIDRIYSITINIGMAKGWLDPWMVALSSKWIWIVFVVFWAILAGKNRHRWALFLVAAFAVSCADLFAFEVLKPYFGRIRPCKEFYYVRVVHSCGGMLSFPSNHATNGLTVATLVAFWDRRLVGIPLLMFAILVAFSRVYLGVHYLGDIVAGALLGVLWATLLTYAISKIPALQRVKNLLQKTEISM